MEKNNGRLKIPENKWWKVPYLWSGDIGVRSLTKMKNKRLRNRIKTQSKTIDTYSLKW